MPRYKNEDNNFYSPPEIQRIIIPKKGVPSIKILFDPKLNYAIGKTEKYIKEKFIVSVLDDSSYETLFLYTNFDKKSIIENKEIKVKETMFLNLSYNEKIDNSDVQKALLEYEKTKVLSERAHQIENGAVLYIQKDNSLTQAYQIALEEFKQKKIPFIICRPLPNAGGYEYWKLNDLLY